MQVLLSRKTVENEKTGKHTRAFYDLVYKRKITLSTGVCWNIWIKASHEVVQTIWRSIPTFAGLKNCKQKCKIFRNISFLRFAISLRYFCSLVKEITCKSNNAVNELNSYKRVCCLFVWTSYIVCSIGYSPTRIADTC